MTRPVTAAALATAFLFISAAAPAQSPSPAASLPQGYRVAGRVLDSVTGDPVPRATVSLLSRDYQGAIVSAVTGPDGRFSFDNIPAGKHPLNASRRGYRSAFYDEHENFNSAIVTGPGLDTGHLEFRLAPGAVLHGTVTDDAGDPVESAQVLLFRTSSESGPRIRQAATTQTDDTGNYEFAGLPSGEYYVAVSGEPWYAQHRSIYTGASPDPSPLDVAFPVTFYDSTIDERAATPIALEAGSRDQADIQMHAVPALHFRLPTSKQPGGNSFFLQQHIFGNTIPAESEQLAGEHGLTEITGVAPGSYEAEMGNPPRHMLLNATTDEDVSFTDGTASVSVSGSVTLAGGGPLPASLTVSLISAGKQQPTIIGVQNGRFHFDDVLPGAFDLTAAAGDQQLAVIATSSGKTSTPGGRITVGDQPLDLAITLTPANVNIQGFARNGNAPAPGAMIVLAPADPRDFAALVRRDQSDTDGSFELRGVAPGLYALIAIQDGWKLDWQNPRVLAAYLAHGTPVTVTRQSPPVLRLAEPVPVQSRLP